MADLSQLPNADAFDAVHAAIEDADIASIRTTAEQLLDKVDLAGAEVHLLATIDRLASAKAAVLFLQYLDYCGASTDVSADVEAVA